MTYRPDIHGRGMALSCDKTTTGAWLITSLPVPNYNVCGYGLIRKGDKTTPCPACGKLGMVAEGEARFKVIDIPIAVDGCVVHCGCPEGSNRIIAPLGQWMGAGPSPAEIAQKKQAELIAQRKAEREAEEKRREEERERNRVFAKSCLRGEGCNDAGDQREPHTNFAPMGIYQAVPQTDPVTDTETPQRAQAVKKKKLVAPEDIPKPKKRSALWKWWNGHHEEMDYQRAVEEAERAQRARAAIAGASVLRPVAGNFAIRGTWAVVGETATGVAGLPLAAFLIGMMPGRLNDGEQDFIDRMRAEQAREVPTRVRFTWETNSRGNPVPHGWHTPPGQDRVRVRRMEWDDRRKAYTFTTEEDPRITLIWTPDNPGIDVPYHTGNQYPPVLPNPVMVDPLPDDTGLHATTSPAPEEKDFADYILILPFPDIPPIYIYIRNNAGQVTGKGQKISGAWLVDADKGNGAPVPSQIAERMRGRTFANFDRFREAFWAEVANDADLSRQFRAHNLTNIRKGRSPFTREVERVGGRERYEIHHIKPISEGGEVYNVDNMGITTPKRHIEIHRGK
ncbi:S-type pyocin domain-containing protein [Escherichia coli]|uniref:S-type pyocin domain-containing protein n=1 Tax=Escherichia coli TaxID=562 RepID=UPI0005F8F0D5|nr:S-type pyocin domain-containing protein [Escherichia coli]EEW8806207.1 pyocin [Escherichia coli]EFC4827312.1 pyocin [Escherichia coli]EHU9776943.1 S-type pyocin domain-containing protein [Escherichia coli]EMD6592529.1 S-type pyocin domain-containing protein [Escherichia coli]KJW43882.1 pyocin [Escherichia coli]